MFAKDVLIDGILAEAVVQGKRPSAMIDTQVAVKLDGVPETLLWALHNRAAGARRSDAILRDPIAVKLADAIDYPFAEHFGPPDESHALRSLRFDEEVRRFLRRHPDGTVVNLGEGLETQFWRVDNGRVNWMSIDLPESIEVRRSLLPAHERLHNLACSALDFRWMDQVDSSRGVFITAQGLLMYFRPADVQTLIAQCAARFPGAEMMFDVMPQWISRRTMSSRGWQKTSSYRTPPMPWGIDGDELDRIRAFHPNIVEVRRVDPGPGRSFLFGYLVPALRRVPVIGNKLPACILLRFGR
jgi:O-methyltransferase involved in polyketide biosynthesis